MSDEPGTAVRTPPHHIEVEQVVLSSILADERALKQAKDLLNPVYFADALHAGIAAACLELARRGEIANPITVRRLLSDSEGYDGDEGKIYLARLASCGRTAGLRGYILRLQDLYLRRVLIAEAERMIERASTSEGDQRV